MNEHEQKRQDAQGVPEAIKLFERLTSEERATIYGVIRGMKLARDIAVAQKTA